jgi:hypothetical protein
MPMQYPTLGLHMHIVPTHVVQEEPWMPQCKFVGGSWQAAPSQQPTQHAPL